MAAHVHIHHDHDHGQGGRTNRQANEAAVYDARAEMLLAETPDEALLVDRSEPPFPNREHRDFLTYALAQIPTFQDKRVLEVGCGSGNLSTWFALQGAQATGVDVSEVMLKLARRRAQVNGVDEAVTLLDQPIETLDAPDGSFDMVIGNQVLHHLELDESMANIRRLLSPNGVAVFCEPVLFLPEVSRRVRYNGLVTRLFPSRADTPDERSLGMTEIHRVLDAFPSSEWRPFQLLCRLQNFVELPDGAFHMLERIDRFVLKRVPGAYRLCRYVVVVLRPRSVT